MDRRTFIAGALSMGVLGAGALTGCAPKSSGQQGSNGDAADGSNGSGAAISAEEQAFIEAAEPIAPVEAPTSWDGEYDVVIVGAGGGGITAAVRLSAAGKKVALVEKNSATGGESANVLYFVNPGGHRLANEAQWAVAGFPYSAEATAQYFAAQYQNRTDPQILRLMAENDPKLIDWLEEEMGAIYMPTPYLDPVYGLSNLWLNGEAMGTDAMGGFKLLLENMTKVAQDQGCEVMTSTEAMALVQENGRITGLKVEDSEGEKFLHATTGVLLTAGGFLNNRSLMKKYCPQCLDGIGAIAPWTANNGACIRMGVGAGADMAGYNAVSCYDGGVFQGDYGEYDIEFRPRTSAAEHVAAQPWMMINRDGDRVPYFNGTCAQFPYANTGNYLNGFGVQSNVEMSQPGGRVYVCFDSKVIDIMGEQYFKQVGPRYAPPVTQEDLDQLVSQGTFFRADTIEDLEQQMGLATGTLTENVTKWNDACATGKDFFELYPYEKEWLITIDEAPFYGAMVGGENYESKCGLRINTNMQVISTEGTPIEGLYAGWHTAGGSQGDLTMNGVPFVGMLGNGCLSFTGGYVAADCILANA